MSRREGRENTGSIPDRWLGCPRKSLQLLVDKFLIFKTPLSHRFDDQVPEECLFPVEFVFNSMKSYKLKLGLWIDLTNTTRFYDRQDVEKHECKYLKLQCRGFGQPPTVEQTQTFIETCHDFLSHHPLEIIGVHCTHGFNRSGFLLVSFLVEKYDWQLGAALMKFAQVRPPGIYKKDYIVELYQRYDDVEFAPKPPPLPDWCFDEKEEEDNDNDNNDDDDDDDNNRGKDDDNDDDDNEDDNDGGNLKRKRHYNDGDDSHSKKGNKKRKKEFVNKNPKFMAGVPGVEPVTEPLLGVIQKTVQDMCEWKDCGFPGSQPVSMTQENITLLSKEEYTVSWKADGVRYLMYIKEKGEVYFIDRDNSVFKVKNLSFPYKKNIHQHIKKTLLDGEMVIDKVQGQNIPRYLVYDIVVINDYPIRIENFRPTRLDAIKYEIVEPRHKAMQLGLINKAKEPFSVRLKEFFPVKDAYKFLSDKFYENLSHEPDGLIFQPAKGPYWPGTFHKLLKWKPASLNSVDFRLKITMEKGVGILPKKIGELYVSGRRPRFGVLKSVKNLHDLNNKIIECKLENNSWVFMRERSDRSFPNSYDTAMSVYKSIIHPVTQEMLLGYIETSRYEEHMPPPMAPPPRSQSSRHFH